MWIFVINEKRLFLETLLISNIKQIQYAYYYLLWN